jgi:putative phosphoserine phosphatase/1-acylglycerol-3-phosphate O-acyltransferase
LADPGTARSIFPAGALECRILASTGGTCLPMFYSVRSSLLAVTLPLAAIASLPVLLFTWSMRRTVNCCIGLWADLNCALIGMKVSVNGNEHLISPRPAVFILNHQSNADGFLVAKLIRRDIAILGKKEIAQDSITGRLLRWGGLITVDRENTADAANTMRALTNAIRQEKRSAAIFPEGTRSQATTPGQFQRGAFLIALRAGVPIIPIVIHNSIDVQQRGEEIYRPATVRVDVLAPIDTSTWRIKTLDAHIAEVREMYLRTIGQSQE